VTTIIARMKSFGMNVIEPGTTSYSSCPTKEDIEEMLPLGKNRGARSSELKLLCQRHDFIDSMLRG